jgi:hypothetical protein
MGIRRRSRSPSWANGFVSDTESTIGACFSLRGPQIDGRKQKLKVWDTAGQEPFRSPTYCRDAHIRILVCGVNFPCVWTSGTGTAIISAGNKINLEQNVTAQEGNAPQKGSHVGRSAKQQHGNQNPPPDRHRSMYRKDGAAIRKKRADKRQRRLLLSSVWRFVSETTRLFLCESDQKQLKMPRIDSPCVSHSARVRDKDSGRRTHSSRDSLTR